MTRADTNRSERLARIREVVEFLCSRECGGRQTGSEGNRIARARIVEELSAAGLAPAGSDGWTQPVPGCGGTNVLGRLDRRADDDRYVLVAAHYDHLGHAGDHDAYWGADDNAAAVAIMIDTARTLAAQANWLNRQVLFCAFDAEEPPFYFTDDMGSQHFVHQPLVPLDRIDMMVCMDLMGHAVGADDFPTAVRQSVFALGAERSAGTPALVDEVAARADGVRVRRLNGDVIPPLSDYLAFEAAQVPFLFLTCGRWRHYHEITDTPEKLDYDKIVAASDFLTDLVRTLANRPAGAVRYLPDGRDDLATLASLREIGELVRPHVPSVADGLPILDELEASVRSKGALSSPQRQLLSLLVASLESTLT